MDKLTSSALKVDKNSGCEPLISGYKGVIETVLDHTGRSEDNPTSRLYRKKWGMAPKSPEDHPEVPYQVDIDVADTCNIRCKYCFDRTRKRTGRVMTEDLAESIIHQLASHPVYAVNIGFCSEPLAMAPITFKLLLGIRQARPDIELFLHTNGVQLNEIAARNILEAKVDILCISVAAATPSTYNSVTGADRFKTVMENIQRFKQMREMTGRATPYIRVSMVVFEGNRHEKGLFYDIFKTIADKIEFHNYRNVGATQKRCGNQHSVIKKVVCPWPFMRMSIWPDGKIGVCPFTGSLNGDLALHHSILQDDLKEIWNSDRINQIRRQMFHQGLLTCYHCSRDFEQPS